MRKALLTLSILLSSLIVSNAQCTPDPMFTTSPMPGTLPPPPPGVYPPNIPISGIPLFGISDGQINVPYSQTLTLVVLEDTTLDIGFLLPTALVDAMNNFGISTSMTVDVNHVTFDVQGLPTGLNYQCSQSQSNCQYPSGVNGCILISGIPSQSGTFPLNINMTINIQIPAIPSPIPVVPPFPTTAVDIPTFPGQQYDLLIAGSSGLEVQKIEKFTIYPNPTSDIAILEFDGKKDVKVLDNLSRIIFTQNNITSTLELSKEQLGTGLFIIEIAGKNKIWREKLIIN